MSQYFEIPVQAHTFHFVSLIYLSGPHVMWNPHGSLHLLISRLPPSKANNVPVRLTNDKSWNRSLLMYCRGLVNDTSTLDEELKCLPLTMQLQESNTSSLRILLINFCICRLSSFSLLDTYFLCVVLEPSHLQIPFSQFPIPSLTGEIPCESCHRNTITASQQWGLRSCGVCTVWYTVNIYNSNSLPMNSISHPLD